MTMMDVDSELQLYNHVEFLSTRNNPRRGQSDRKNVPISKRDQRNRKKQTQPKQTSSTANNKVGKPQQSKKIPHVKYQLTANELLFFPKSYNPTPARQVRTDSNDLHKKKNYIEKIKEQTPEQQRVFRAKRDARYLHQNGSKTAEEDEKVICLDHLMGRCRSEDCSRWHQMRHQRLLGVCKFYLSGVCRNGDACQYMHEEFPCRYYHLDLEHPRLAENESCRFKHGGPLPQRLRQYLRKQIEIWASKIAMNKPEQLDNILMSLMDKFDAKQSKLSIEYDIKHTDTSSMPSSNDRFSLESILTTNQLKRLADRNITNASQINQIPVEQLLDLGLSVDEIYEITMNTCDESFQTPISSEIQPTESNYEDVSSMFCSSETNEKPLQGFSEIEMKDAVEKLQKLELLIKKEVTTEEPSLGIEYDEIEQKTCQLEYTKVAESDDSDDEFSLVINEEFA